MRENRLSKREFYGTDIWRKQSKGQKPEIANGRVAPRGGDPTVCPKDFQPMRSRRNAHSLSYTAFSSLKAATAGL